jgi:hypothetical protein
MTYLRLIFFFLCGLQLQAQNLSGILQKAGKLVETQQLNSADISAGLKEALTLGAEKGCAELSKHDGFFKNTARKIAMPPEVQKIESTIRSVGLNQLADAFILSLNRAAEDACKTAAPILIQAIKDMTVSDGISILRGNESAATEYLRNKTQATLAQEFKPTIQTSLATVQATKYWDQLNKAYQSIPFSNKKTNPDLADYVTEKALQGIFDEIALHEKEIRTNPVARTSALLKSLFDKP